VAAVVRRLLWGLAVAGSLGAAGPAAAQSPPEAFGPYDGRIPFRCQLQDVGTGTDYPDPDADPFCVEFDKTNQNVTDFGIAEFTAQEPARVAAAAPKCFYFQRDHWTGSIVQGSEPETWHWDGDYFFDKARGVGGVSVKNFRVGGTPMDASPYAPPAYRPYFDEGGGGGVLVELESGPDPSCAARVDTPEERDRVYGGRGLYRDCIEPGGDLRGKRVGRVRLGMHRERVLRRLGPPRDHRRGVDRWCLTGKGSLRVEYAGRAGPATLIRSSGRGHSARGVARGDRARRARRRLELRPVFRLSGTRVLSAGAVDGRLLLIGTARRVRWVAIADRNRLDSARALRRALRRSR
jgi:hypothetical protein